MTKRVSWCEIEDELMERLNLEAEMQMQKEVEKYA